MMQNNYIKDTKFDELPSDWSILELSNVATITMGQSPPSSTYNSDGIGLPFLQGKAEFGDIYPNPKKWCTQPQKLAKSGSILISVRAPVGIVNIAKDEYIIGRGLASINGHKILDNRYLFFYLLHSKTVLEKKGTGSIFKSINKGVLEQFNIPVPPLQEQCAIAQVLSTVRHVIDATDRVIAAARELKRSMMKHLFTYGPIPIEQADKVLLKETEIGNIPDSWKIRTISDLGEIITGRTPSTKNLSYYGGHYKLISPANLGENQYVESAHLWLTEKGLGVAKELPKDSVLVSCIGYIGKVGLTYDCRSATNQQINAIICKSKTNPKFVYYLVSFFQKYIENHSRVTTIPILNKTNFKQIAIPLPNIDIQNEIAENLDALTQKINAEIENKAALKTLFSSLLHHLMTGKVRVQMD